MTTLAQSRDAGAARPRLSTALAAGAGFAVVFTALGAFNVFNGEEESFDGQGLVNWAVCLSGILVASLICWRTSAAAVDRADAAALARRALLFGVLSLLSLPVFWLGLYGPFAAAALFMGGLVLLSAAPRSSKGMAALGMLSAVAGTAVCALNNVVG